MMMPTNRPKPDPSQGARPDEPPLSQLTREHLASMTPEEIRAAQEAGQFRDLLAGRFA